MHKCLRSLKTKCILIYFKQAAVCLTRRFLDALGERFRAYSILTTRMSFLFQPTARDLLSLSGRYPFFIFDSFKIYPQNTVLKHCCPCGYLNFCRWVHFGHSFIQVACLCKVLFFCTWQTRGFFRQLQVIDPSFSFTSLSYHIVRGVPSSIIFDFWT